ncbi:alpha/beta hydrolase [Streptomyces fildesensis]|uniref:Alpha/beta hydrolase n=1 Tax=Streptomyces fildesensis TaxID=375757 RepID=A0ABW8C5V2_9ACTN
MFGNDPKIDLLPALTARAFQMMFRPMFKLQYSSPQVQFATKDVAKPTRITIPTRHGEIRALLYSPTDEDVAAQRAAGRRPPVHLILHGGAFIVGVPQQEDNVARYLASEVGGYVVVPDYDTAPKVRFPVSEEQAYDIFRWIQSAGAAHGWDGERVSVGGPSSGGKLVLTLTQMAIDAGDPLPVAISVEFGLSDPFRPNSARTSAKARPVVAPSLMDLTRSTYFKGADPRSPLTAPLRYDRLAEFPPTLILTAEHDTLRHEMNELADELAAKGVPVTHREFAGVDHGFTHVKPVEVAREAITMIGDLLRKTYA